MFHICVQATNIALNNLSLVLISLSLNQVIRCDSRSLSCDDPVAGVAALPAEICNG